MIMIYLTALLVSLGSLSAAFPTFSIDQSFLASRALDSDGPWGLSDAVAVLQLRGEDGLQKKLHRRASSNKGGGAGGSAPKSSSPSAASSSSKSPSPPKQRMGAGASTSSTGYKPKGQLERSNSFPTAGNKASKQSNGLRRTQSMDSRNPRPGPPDFRRSQTMASGRRSGRTAGTLSPNSRRTMMASARRESQLPISDRPESSRAAAARARHDSQLPMSDLAGISSGSRVGPNATDRPGTPPRSPPSQQPQVGETSSNEPTFRPVSAQANRAAQRFMPLHGDGLASPRTTMTLPLSDPQSRAQSSSSFSSDSE